MSACESQFHSGAFLRRPSFVATDNTGRHKRAVINDDESRFRVQGLSNAIEVGLDVPLVMKIAVQQHVIHAGFSFKLRKLVVSAA